MNAELIKVLTRIAEALERLAPPEPLDPPSVSVAGEHKSSSYFARGKKCPVCEQSHFVGETCPYVTAP